MKARLVISMIFLILLSACATAPSMQDNAALQEADTVIEVASEDQNVRKYAAVELEKAKDTFDQAEAAWHNTGDKTRTNHLAYMAQRRAQIAEAVAEKARHGRSPRRRVKNARICKSRNCVASWRDSIRGRLTRASY